MVDNNQEYERLQGLGENITPEQKEEMEKYKKMQNEKKVVHRVIAGHNDLFVKHYKFDEMDLEFDIKVKFPNIREQALIQASTERYFEGLGSLMPLNVIKAYRMLATLRECGKDVPDVLAKDEEIYNIYIFNVIAEDFQEWMNTFQF